MEKDSKKELTKEQKINNNLNTKGLIGIKSKRIYQYVIPLGLVISYIVTLLLMYFFKARPIFFILYIIFTTPLFILSGFILLVRIFYDKSKIGGEVIKRVSRNFIVANFWTENRKTRKVYCLLSKTGKTFVYKSGLYIIDMKTVWYDDDKNPNSYYIEGIPNPILLGFETNIQEYISKTLEGNPQLAKDKHGLLIDIAYSSQALQLFKKDKIFEEFHKNPSSDKMLGWAFGLIGILIIAIIIIVVISLTRGA